MDCSCRFHGSSEYAVMSKPVNRSSVPLQKPSEQTSPPAFVRGTHKYPARPRHAHLIYHLGEVVFVADTRNASPTKSPITPSVRVKSEHRQSASCNRDRAEYEQSAVRLNRHVPCGEKVRNHDFDPTRPAVAPIKRPIRQIASHRHEISLLVVDPADADDSIVPLDKGEYGVSLISLAETSRLRTRVCQAGEHHDQNSGEDSRPYGDTPDRGMVPHQLSHAPIDQPAHNSFEVEGLRMPAESRNGRLFSLSYFPERPVGNSFYLTDQWSIDRSAWSVSPRKTFRRAAQRNQETSLLLGRGSRIRMSPANPTFRRRAFRRCSQIRIEIRTYTEPSFPG